MQAATGSAEPHTIVPVLDTPAGPDAFPGLYIASFTDSTPFISSATLLVTSQWRSQSVVLAIDTDTGVVTPVTPTDAAQGSFTLQGVCNGLAAAVLSRPSAPPQLVLATIPAADGGAAAARGAWEWVPVAGLVPDLKVVLPDVAAALANLETRILDVVPTVGDTSHTFQALIQVGGVCDCVYK